MNSGKFQLPTKIIALLKFRLSLTGEANNNIGGDSYLRHYTPN
ncbi:unnamed protein product [marine sediment metagenome]|uniref:Uncharacterized protein n=1 Tax=marine sediment metagenome TaxID=412755 RepID=X1TNH0_9ZZZZ